MSDLTVLEEYLRDPDPRIRRAAVELLGETALGGAGDALAWALADEDAEVRAAAALALATLRPPVGEDGIDALRLAAAGGKDPLVRGTAKAHLTLLADAHRALYAQGLADDEPQIRAQAVLALTSLRAADAVREAADDPARDVRVAVADGLARLDSADGLDQLLDDHDPVVRLAALDAAAALGLPDALVPPALRALRHSSWQVRKRAARVLAGAPAAEAASPLSAALRDPVVDVRREAVQSLEQWASHDPNVLAALTEALTDPDPGVRTQVRWAVFNCRSSAAAVIGRS
ncbi:HEAT repeat domain-containing protein [Actinocorallia sp. A-T 12471]|uniref:HEAT repeat domain-containing protein n=1 Tax=Actinocorallia sp. A-T 12471 TaxID=3089813 RepID=UPI0029D11753|nr:HEAT repeat domain-containing protein [Actinocorallia sp. A-T 12471]MDX6739095.1 HEAT repeat domain-containing protein [Actinocorallia sp. A-T 12471]